MIYYSYMGANMESFIAPIIVIIIVFAVLSALIEGPTKKRKGKQKRPQQKKTQLDAKNYVQVGQLLSPAELNFYRLLLKVLANPGNPHGPPQAVVMSKVRATDLVQVRKGLDRSAWQSAFNRIKSKHVDFVLCEPGTMQVVCVIELDDKSHKRGDREERDSLMDSIYEAVGLPILHVDCRRGYSMQEVGGMIREAVRRGRE